MRLHLFENKKTLIEKNWNYELFKLVGETEVREYVKYEFTLDEIMERES